MFKYLFSLIFFSSLVSCHKHENPGFTENFNSSGSWEFAYGDINDTAFITNHKLTLLAETNIDYSNSYAEAKLPIAFENSKKICFRIYFDDFNLKGNTDNGFKDSYLKIQIGNLEIRNTTNPDSHSRILGGAFIDIEVNIKKNKIKVKKNEDGANITDYFTLNEVSSFDNFILFGAKPVFSPSLGTSFSTSVQISSIEVFYFD